MRAGSISMTKIFKKPSLIKVTGEKAGERHRKPKNNMINIHQDFSRLKCWPKPNQMKCKDKVLDKEKEHKTKSNCTSSG